MDVISFANIGYLNPPCDLETNLKLLLRNWL